MTDDVIKNVCNVITLISAILVWNQTPNSPLQFQPSIPHFFKNFGNDVINFKVIFFNLNFKINFYAQLGTFTTFGLAVGWQRLFDTRWQTLKTKKGEVPRPKHGDFCFGGSEHGPESSCQISAYYKFFPGKSYFYRTNT